MRITTALFIALILLPFWALSQNITGSQLLEKTIQFHDPEGQWPTANIRLDLTGEYANGMKISQKVWFNLPASTYRMENNRDGNEVVSGMVGDSCFATLNGSQDISEEDQKKHRLECGSIERMRNYYLYLYGLPMKLKDPGTNLAEVVTKQTIQDKEYLVLRVDYKPPVGDLTWLFFIDPKTYAMEAYQFYGDEETKAGEIIYLEDLQTVGNMKLPAKRKWYKLPGDEFLGTDIINGGEVLKE